MDNTNYGYSRLGPGEETMEALALIHSYGNDIPKDDNIIVNMGNDTIDAINMIQTLPIQYNLQSTKENNINMPSLFLQQNNMKNNTLNNNNLKQISEQQNTMKGLILQQQLQSQNIPQQLNQQQLNTNNSYNLQSNQTSITVNQRNVPNILTSSITTSVPMILDRNNLEPINQIPKPEKYKSIKGEPRRKSKYKGVFKCGKKFKAQIQMKNVQTYLGTFDTPEDAAKAYDAYALQSLGPKAKTNFDYGTSKYSVTQNQKVESHLNFSSIPKSEKCKNDDSQFTHIFGDDLGFLFGSEENDNMICNYIAESMGMKFLPDIMQENFAPDWTDQIFYYCGELVFNQQSLTCNFSGHWIGSFTGKPKTAEFQICRNKFEYRMINPFQNSTKLEVQQNYVTISLPASGDFSGYFSMVDNDEEQRWEENIQLDFRHIEGNKYRVIGKGHTVEPFIMTGYYSHDENIIEFSRKYISVYDERARYTTEQLHNNIEDIN